MGAAARPAAPARRARAAPRGARVARRRPRRDVHRRRERHRPAAAPCRKPTRSCSSTRSRRSAASPSTSTAGAIDACYSGTQKCLGVPPGLSPVTFSERAVERVRSRSERRRSRGTSTSACIGDYVGGATRKYHHTAPVSMIFSLHAGLGAVLDEGLEHAWARHRGVGDHLHQALPELGFQLVAPEGHRLPQLTSAWLPDGADDAKLRRRSARHVRHRGRRRPRRVRRQGVADRPHGPLRPRPLGHHPPRRPPGAARLSRLAKKGLYEPRSLVASAGGAGAGAGGGAGRSIASR